MEQLSTTARETGLRVVEAARRTGHDGEVAPDALRAFAMSGGPFDDDADEDDEDEDEDEDEEDDAPLQTIGPNP